MRRACSSIGSPVTFSTTRCSWKIASPEYPNREPGAKRTGSGPSRLFAPLAPVRETARVRQDHPGRDPPALLLEGNGRRRDVLRQRPVEVESSPAPRASGPRSAKTGFVIDAASKSVSPVTGAPGPHVGHAPGPRPGDLPVAHEGDRHPGDVELAHQDRRQPLDRRDGRLPGGRADPSRRVDPLERERGSPPDVLVAVVERLAQRGNGRGRGGADGAERVRRAPADVLLRVRRARRRARARRRVRPARACRARWRRPGGRSPSRPRAPGSARGRSLRRSRRAPRRRRRRRTGPRRPASRRATRSPVPPPARACRARSRRVPGRPPPRPSGRSTSAAAGPPAGACARTAVLPGATIDEDGREDGWLHSARRTFLTFGTP